MSNIDKRTAGLSAQDKRVLLNKLLQKKAKAFKSFPLSFAQERLWFLDQLERESPFYNIPTAFYLRGSLNTVAFKQSINEIVRRHEVLRTTFTTVDGQPVQVITPNLNLNIPLVDLQALSETGRKAEVLRLVIEEAQHRFGLNPRSPGASYFAAAG